MTRLPILALLPALLLACGEDDAKPAADGGGDGGGSDCDALTWFQDADGDGFGGPESTQACEAPSGYVSQSTDCDDTDAAVNPDAVEVCDGADNDCDGGIDDSAADLLDFFVDGDGDGFGDDAQPVQACALGEGLSEVGGDCDDADAASHPDGVEVCDGADNDCDGTADGTAVPGDHATIQEAIDAAVDGDLICLDAGTYPETITIAGKGVRLGGAGPEETRIGPAAGLSASLPYSVQLDGADGTELMGLSLGPVDVRGSVDVYVDDVALEGTRCARGDCWGMAFGARESSVEFVDVWVRDAVVEVSGAGTVMYEGMVSTYDSDLTWTGGGITGNTLDFEADKVLGYGLLRINGGTFTGSDLVIEDNAISGTAYSSASYLSVAHQGFAYFNRTDASLEDVWFRGNAFQATAGRTGGSGGVNAQATAGVQHEGGTLVWTGGGLEDNFSNNGGTYQSRVYLGVYALDAVTFTDVSIVENELYAAATHGTDGVARCAGLHINEGDTTLTRLDMRGNQINCDGVDTDNYGGIVTWNGTTAIESSVIAGNYLASGGDVYGLLSLNYQTARPTLTNVTIHDNAMFAPRAISGVLHTTVDGVDVVNSAITDNSVTAWGGDADHPAAAVLHMAGDFGFGFTNSLIHGNYSSEFVDIDVAGTERIGDVLGQDGNIDAEPGYVDVEGTVTTDWDLHPAAGSALIDAGHGDILDADGSASDIGAYGGPAGAW